MGTNPLRVFPGPLLFLAVDLVLIKKASHDYTERTLRVVGFFFSFPKEQVELECHFLRADKFSPLLGRIIFEVEDC